MVRPSGIKKKGFLGCNTTRAAKSYTRKGHEGDQIEKNEVSRKNHEVSGKVNKPLC